MIASARIGEDLGPNLRVSVIINNYNYGRFLGEAIDSVLSQDYSPYELIVVDDGSTDDSREVIGRYGKRIVSVLKPNGGQGSAINEGFARSSGEIVLFLDSDDFLLPGALRAACRPFTAQEVVQLVTRLQVVDATGRLTGATIPSSPDPFWVSNNVCAQTLRFGAHSGRPDTATSGYVWRRFFLESVLPMPTEPFRLSADAYL
jgi:glycosyltransferase involved in cell wall biosynthesis